MQARATPDPRRARRPEDADPRRRPARLHEGDRAPAGGVPRAARGRVARARPRRRWSRSRPRAGSGSSTTRCSGSGSSAPSGGSTATSAGSALPAVHYLHQSYSRSRARGAVLRRRRDDGDTVARRHEPRRQGVRRRPHRPRRRAGAERVRGRSERAATRVPVQPARSRRGQGRAHARDRGSADGGPPANADHAPVPARPRRRPLGAVVPRRPGGPEDRRERARAGPRRSDADLDAELARVRSAASPGCRSSSSAATTTARSRPSSTTPRAPSRCPRPSPPSARSPRSRRRPSRSSRAAPSATWRRCRGCRARFTSSAATAPSSTSGSSSALRPELVELHARLLAELTRDRRRAIHGVRLEVKPASIALHVRGVDRRRGEQRSGRRSLRPRDVARHPRDARQGGGRAVADRNRQGSGRRRAARAGVCQRRPVPRRRRHRRERRSPSSTAPTSASRSAPGETLAAHRVDEPIDAARVLGLAARDPPALALRRARGADRAALDALQRLHRGAPRPRREGDAGCATRDPDSAAIFADILGGTRAGYFSVAPVPARHPARPALPPGNDDGRDPLVGRHRDRLARGRGERRRREASRASSGGALDPRAGPDGHAAPYGWSSRRGRSSAR